MNKPKSRKVSQEEAKELIDLANSVEQKQSWEERLKKMLIEDERFSEYQINPYVVLRKSDLFSCISQEIQKAREEERKLIFDKILKYQAGFVKDSGSGFICSPEFGVIDELIKIINK